jgi:hypothetical protein
MNTEAKLVRTTFRTSREMDFFSERELVTQTGHDRSEWPLVICKELIDNSIDAAEESRVAPMIEVCCDAGGISVADNGPGLPESTLEGQLDFSKRVSSREAYVSPCRGAQGNALKTLLPMPYVLDSENGRVIVEASGLRHTISCRMDSISQRPAIHHERQKSKNRKLRLSEKKLAQNVGTFFRLDWKPIKDEWPFQPRPLDHWREPVQRLVEGFALFNPHLTISLEWFGEARTWKATNLKWKKWLPSDWTSSHWYAHANLERLIGAYITHERDQGLNGNGKLVNDFLAEFDGLSGSAKRTKVLNDCGLKRLRLSELATDGQLDTRRIDALLAAMRRYTRPIKSERLGLIGEVHFRARFLEMGIKPESFRYEKKLAKPEKVKNEEIERDEKASFLPWVLESAFGWLGQESEDERKIFAGANWSAAIKNPFRSFGSTGEGLEAELNNLKAGAYEPIIFALHLAHPRISYTDRGKSALIIEGDGEQEEHEEHEEDADGSC